MNKFIIVITTIFFASGVSAKKVKFAVNMSGNIVNTTGIHVFGDFQTVAGFAGGDWAPNTTTLTRETADTNIYSIVIDIPAFAKYEYKFLNGDQSYEVEFIPVESRVGYNFNDNRWLYVDSLADDTTFVGAIRFAQNSPNGLTLVRFLIDVQNEPSIAATGIHVAGNFQGWDPAITRLYSFVPGVYEIIAYVTAGTYEYRYYNGNVAGATEIIPLPCTVNNNRQVVANHDTALSLICFSGCSTCVLTGISENKMATEMKLFPNPANSLTTLEFNDNDHLRTVTVSDLTGRVVRYYNSSSERYLQIYRHELDAGIYLVTARTVDGLPSTIKLVIE